MNSSVTLQSESEKTSEENERMFSCGESKSKIEEEEEDILPKIEELMLYMAAHLRKEKVPLMESKDYSEYHRERWIEYVTLLKVDGLYWKFANLVMQEHGTHLCHVFAKPETKELWIGSRPMWENYIKENKALPSGGENIDDQPKLEELMLYMAAHLRKEKVPLMESKDYSEYHREQWIEYVNLLKVDGLYWKFANLVMQEHGTHLCHVFAKPETKALWIGSRPMWEEICKNKK